MNETVSTTNHTFRRFENGESMWNWDDLTKKILQADHSHKCPTYVLRTPPCQNSCPSGHDIRGWLAIARGMDKPPVKDMKWQEYAFQRMVEANPFPATMGRVCPAPCENGCSRNEVDDFVGINAVEQYVGDWAIEHKLPLPAAPALDGKRVAVVGGGPGGLTAAYFIRRKGHAVVLFDANEELGGMMRFGIPGYRTPRPMIDAEIGRILALGGIETRLGVRVGKDVSLDELDREFDAVYWACGAQKGRPLPVPGGDAENCITGVEFLDAFNRGWVASTAKRIVVVGGGDTSIDVASVARRLGYIGAAGGERPEAVAVVLTSLFPIEKMTAAAREREDAMREGVEIKGAVMPLEIIKDERNRATAIRMCQCTMKGMTPIAIEGTEFEIPCDMVISAIGQMADLAEGLEKLDNGRAAIAVDGLLKVRKSDKYFAGGDVVRPHLLTTAIGHGRVAADAIDRFLAGLSEEKRPKVDVHQFDLLTELNARGLDPEPYDHTQRRGTSAGKFAIHNYEDRSSVQVISHEELFKGHFGYVARNLRNERHVGADEVLGDFEERTTGLSEEQVRKEGERCMSCGLCFECDNCVIFCPQVAVQRVPKKERAIGRYVTTDYTKCIGCHVCMDVCPTGYIQMGLGE